MAKGSLEGAVEYGVDLLADVLPQRPYLYAPLLFSAIVWLIRRPEVWKEKVLSWTVWPDPGRIRVKPREFMTFFFEADAELRHAFRAEIESGDWKTLGRAFSRLYPVLGLEEPFLSALFHEELEAKDYRSLVERFDARLRQARLDIEPLRDSSALWRALGAFGEEIALLSLDLVSQAKVRKIVTDLVKDAVRKTDGSTTL